MAEYLVIYRQEGGCDYTIGCGVRIEEFIAPSMEDAIEEALSEDCRPSCGLEDLGSIVIYEVIKEESLDLPRIIKDKKEAKQKLESQRKEREELKQLEELAKRYGKKLTDY